MRSTTNKSDLNDQQDSNKKSSEQYTKCDQYQEEVSSLKMQNVQLNNQLNEKDQKIRQLGDIFKKYQLKVASFEKSNSIFEDKLNENASKTIQLSSQCDELQEKMALWKTLYSQL